MGWVWVWDWHVEVTEPRVTPLVNQTVSVTLSNYHVEPCSISSSCDIIVIPSQE